MIFRKVEYNTESDNKNMFCAGFEEMLNNTDAFVDSNGKYVITFDVINGIVCNAEAEWMPSVG